MWLFVDPCSNPCFRWLICQCRILDAQHAELQMNPWNHQSMQCAAGKVSLISSGRYDLTCRYTMVYRLDHRFRIYGWMVHLIPMTHAFQSMTNLHNSRVWPITLTVLSMQNGNANQDLLWSTTYYSIALLLYRYSRGSYFNRIDTKLLCDAARPMGDFVAEMFSRNRWEQAVKLKKTIRISSSISFITH